MMSMGAFLLGKLPERRPRECGLRRPARIVDSANSGARTAASVLSLITWKPRPLETRIGRAEVGSEALELGGGAHGHPDVDRRGVLDADPGGLRLVDVDGEVREEQPGLVIGRARSGSSIDCSQANGDVSSARAGVAAPPRPIRPAGNSMTASLWISRVPKRELSKVRQDMVADSYEVRGKRTDVPGNRLTEEIH
jgi:hypothetical protein